MTMGSRVSVGDEKKLPDKRAKSGGPGAHADKEDSMTLLDMIRTTKKPTRQLKRPSQLLAKEEDQHMVETTDYISSDSDEDLGSVRQQYKRKRKCRDLYCILKREPPVSGFTPDRPDESKQLEKAKNSVSFKKKKTHLAHPSPPSARHTLERLAGSPIRHQSATREMMKTPMGLGKPVALSNDQALDDSNAQVRGIGKREKSRAPAPRRPLKAANEAQSSPQSQWLETSDSEADFLPVSGAGLHTCPDPKNCKAACVAKAVAPNLDHMSEEELIYWYQVATRKKFTSRSGEKVSGRIRRAIRAEVKKASAPNKSHMSAFGEAERCESSSLEPRTPSPGKLVVDLHPQDSPPCGFPASVGAKEDLACAFNSAASFDEFVDEGIDWKSSNFSSVKSGTAPLKEAELVEYRFSIKEVGPAKKCEPVESTVAKAEPSVVVPADFASDLKHGSHKYGNLESECGYTPSSCEKTTLMFQEARCGDIMDGSQTESLEEKSRRPSVDSELSDSASRGVADSHSLPGEVSEDFGSVLNSHGKEENERGQSPPLASDEIPSSDTELKDSASVGIVASRSLPVEVSENFGSVANSHGMEENERGQSPLPSADSEWRDNASLEIVDSRSLCVKVMEEFGTVLNKDGMVSERGQSLLPSGDCELRDSASLEIAASRSLTVEVSDDFGSLPISLGVEEDERDQSFPPADIPSSDSVLRDSASLGIVDARSLAVVVSEDFGSVPNPYGMEAESTCHQPSGESIRESTEAVLKSPAAELCQSTVEIEGSAEILLECDLGEDLSVRSDDGKSPKRRSGSSPSSLAGEDGLWTPDFRPSSPTRQQVSAHVQYGMPSQAREPGSSMKHADLNDSSETCPPDSLEAAAKLEPNDKVMSITSSSNSGVPVTEHHKDREDPVAEDSSQFQRQAVTAEAQAHGLVDPQQSAPLLLDLPDRNSETIVGIRMELETTQRAVRLCCTSSSHQSADVLIEARHDSPVEVAGSAETCHTAEGVKGSHGEVLATCHRSPIPSEISGDEMGLRDSENVSILPISPADKEAEDRVLSLEEYIAVHRGEDAASPSESVEDVEEDATPQPMEIGDVSQEARDECTEQGLVDQFVTQQMLKDVDFWQNSGTVNEHEEIPGPDGGDLEEDVTVLKMKGMEVSQHITESTTNELDEELPSQRMTEDITSEPLLQGEAVVQLTAEDEAQMQATGDVAPQETQTGNSQFLEEYGFAEPKNGTMYELDKEPVCLEDLEEDLPVPRIIKWANRKNGDPHPHDVAVLDPEDDVFRKAMEEGMSEEENEPDGSVMEVDEVLATQEILEMVLASQLPPKEYTTPQDSEKNEFAHRLEEVNVSQQMEDAQESKEELSSHQLENYVQLGEYDLPPTSEGNPETHSKLSVGPCQAAGPQMGDAVLQSLQENIAPDESAPISESYSSGPRPTMLPEEVVCSQPLGSANVPTHELLEDETAKNSCEQAPEDAVDFPVILSQPRGYRAQEECVQNIMSGLEGTVKATPSLSRRITRASLKLQKTLKVVGEKLVDSTKSSSLQSQGVEPIFPGSTFNCANDCDPPAGARSGTAVPLMSDAEFEQIESFNYASLQGEWPDACKFLDQMELSLFEEDAVVSSPQKRKLSDPENVSVRVKRVAIEVPLQETGPFGRALDISPQRVPEGISMEDQLVPTALSKAVIERNGERREAVDSPPCLATEECPIMEQRMNTKEKADRAIGREKQKMLLEESPPSMNCQKPNPSACCVAQGFDPLADIGPEHIDCPASSPESYCDLAAVGHSNGCVDLPASEKTGDEECSQDFEPPSKLPCRRKTISPLSQLELMRASSSNSPPSSDESPTQKIPAFRLKLPVGLASQHKGPSPLDCEPIPGCTYSDPNIITGKSGASNGNVVSLDSSEDDTEDCCHRQEPGSRGLGVEEPVSKFSLCLSPTSPSPESVRTDSSQNTSTQEPCDSQSLTAPSSKGILKTGTQLCKGLCKCAACSLSRAKAGTAADFIASQMKTFQLIAGRLTKEMHGLRSIIETNHSSPGENNMMKETLKKSRDVEEAAEKNLTILVRDCKRYCKLTTAKPIPMRKIVFADEAGKKLCHVKTFQSQTLPKSVLDLL